jgi:hypothetical protein
MVPPLSCSAVWISGWGHQPVIQRHDATDYIDGFGAREAGAHNPWSGSLYDWRIAGNHGRHGEGAAGEVDGLRVNIIFGEDTGILGHPDHQLVGADAAIPYGKFSRLR